MSWREEASGKSNRWHDCARRRSASQSGNFQCFTLTQLSVMNWISLLRWAWLQWKTQRERESDSPLAGTSWHLASGASVLSQGETDVLVLWKCVCVCVCVWVWAQVRFWIRALMCVRQCVIIHVSVCVCMFQRLPKSCMQLCWTCCWIHRGGPKSHPLCESRSRVIDNCIICHLQLHCYRGYILYIKSRTHHGLKLPSMRPRSA